MERKKASDFPQELLNLFDHYVHGEANRRQFLDGAAKYAVGGLTAVALWESLRANYALAQQIPKDDKRIHTEYASVVSAK
jgi:carboxymethylenebutenolidase